MGQNDIHIDVFWSIELGIRMNGDRATFAGPSELPSRVYHGPFQQLESRGLAEGSENTSIAKQDYLLCEQTGRLLDSFCQMKKEIPSTSLIELMCLQSAQLRLILDDRIASPDFGVTQTGRLTLETAFEFQNLRQIQP